MRLIILAVVLFPSLILSSCAPLTKVSGYVPLENELADLKVGLSTKAEILEYLGEPLSLNSGSSKTMIYVQQRVETIAFLQPRVKDRTVIQLTFDDSGILSHIKRFHGVTTEQFTPEEEVIVSDGRKLTFWQQMFGNIGNFSSEQFLE